MKNLKTIISIVILIAVVAVIGLVGNKEESSQEVSNVSSSSIVIENDAYDFGDIGIFDGKVSAEYTLVNTGSEDVVITNATTSCGCTEGKIGDESFGMHYGMNNEVVIPANSSVVMAGIYDPLAHGPDAVGPVTRMLMLQTNSILTPEVEVRLSANVIKE